MIFLDESEEIKKLNEMYVNVLPSMSGNITNSIYYNKLKYYLFADIVAFCKEKLELKSDLLELRTRVGDFMSEEDIHNYLDAVKDKYNKTQHNIGIEYHIESTRIDYGVCVFCIIKRDDIYAKKFVFRFRKDPQVGLNLSNLSPLGAPLPESAKKEIRKDIYNTLTGKDKKDEV